MDVDRLCASSKSGIVTRQDWMIAALLALNQGKSAPVESKIATVTTDCAIEDSKETHIVKEVEIKTGETLPTGESSNVYIQSTGPKTDLELVPEVSSNNEQEPNELKAEQTNSGNESDSLIKAIKTLAEPLNVDPLERQDFDTFILEQFQR